jgi:hypothetical protein
VKGKQRTELYCPLQIISFVTHSLVPSYQKRGLPLASTSIQSFSASLPEFGSSDHESFRCHSGSHVHSPRFPVPTRAHHLSQHHLLRSQSDAAWKDMLWPKRPCRSEWASCVLRSLFGTLQRSRFANLKDRVQRIFQMLESFEDLRRNSEACRLAYWYGGAVVDTCVTCARIKGGYTHVHLRITNCSHKLWALMFGQK